MSILPWYKDSFFASPTREDGLRLKILYENGTVYSNIVIESRFEGYKNVVHGGFIFAILDEIIWYTILMEAKKVGLTKKVEMDFFKPVFCDKPYRAQGRFDGIEGKDILASAWVEDPSGERCAQVAGVFREARNLAVGDVLGALDFSAASPEIKEFFYSFIGKRS